jgi:hypothetical protein
VLIASSCRKDSIALDRVGHPNPTSSKNDPYLILRGGAQATARSEEQPVLTVLGASRVNPYTVSEMTAAWNRIYGTSLAQLPATHLYVRFAPTNEEEFKLIDQAVPTQLYDFPLDHEVLVLGDYYEQPGLGEGDWPYFYAVVSPDFQSPVSGFSVLEHLVLLPDDTYVVADAYRSTGNSYTIYREQTDGTFLPYTTPAGCQPGSPDYPFCLTGDTVTTNPIPLPCEPGSPIWPECFWVNDTGPEGSGDPDPPSQTNACGCTLSSNSRNPGGCIQVRETEGGTWEGVRRVKVIMKNTWFTEDKTWTNHQGCFHMDKRFSGEVWTWVRFTSFQCQVRGWSNNLWKPFHALAPIKDYAGKKSGPAFNNYLIRYDLWTNHGSNAHKFWGAATVNNALHEFRDMAATLGIANPPHIDFWVGINTDFGYALMKNHMAGFVLPAVMVSWFIVPYLALPITVNATFLPDVHVGIDFDNTRDVKSLAYHEIAHASHFTKVGQVYWGQLALAEAMALGWGDKHSYDAGRIAVCESWADHVQFLMESMRFNLPGLLNFQLEGLRNFNEDHVPIGLHWDLQDEINDPDPACDWIATLGSTRCGPINDNTSGLTTGQLFQILTHDVTSPIGYREKIKMVYGLNQNDIDNLFESYLDTQ